MQPTAPSTRASAWRPALAVFALALAMYLPGIGRQEFVGTEDFRTRIAVETISGDDPWTPTFYGRPILTKPPLYYWVLGSAVQATGSTAPWSARLPSLAALALTVAILTAAVTAAAGARAGCVAGLGYLLGAYTLKNGVNAEIDPFLTLWVVGAVLAWWQAVAEGTRRPAAWALLAGLCAGLASLSKSYAVVPFLAGMALATWRVGRRPRWPVPAAALLPFLPLATLWPRHLHQLDPAVSAAAIAEGSEMFWAWTDRSLTRTFIYPLALFGACAPFPLAALAKLRAIGRAPLDRYLWWTVCGAFALLLLSAAKSTRYLLACFPLLVGAGVLRLELLARTQDFVRAVCGLFLLAAAVAVPFCFPNLDFAGALTLAALAAAGLAGYLRAPVAPVFALVLLLVPARALVTQVYVPRWEAEESELAGVAALRGYLDGVQSLGVAALETPRMIDPLHKSVHYYDLRRDLAEALRNGARYDALLIGDADLESRFPGYWPAALRAVGDKMVTVYFPSGTTEGTTENR